MTCQPLSEIPVVKHRLLTLFGGGYRMNRDSILLRPATDEGIIFAHYLDEAAEGFFRFMIGRRADIVVATAYLQSDHDLSYQNVTFAEHEGVIVGMVLGYTAEEHRASSRRALIEAAGKRNLRLRIVLVLFAPLMRVIDSIADEDFYLQAIAVSKGMHGSGIGSVLMDHIEDRAMERGSKRLALDVSAKNIIAKRFYENRGMRVESQWPKRLPIGALKFYRFTKVLDKKSTEQVAAG
jgi:ribosomal protein S18 acetylase RimI-like enzyme